MITRLYVVPKKLEKRGGLSAFISYLIEHNLSQSDVLKIAQALTNENIEKFGINNLPSIGSFSYLIEVGFKPGVTDNLAHTTEETIKDLLNLTEAPKVFSSKIFVIQGKTNMTKVKELASSLYNPLIERVSVFSVDEVKRAKSLPAKIPEVLMKEEIFVSKVSLDLNDDGLKELGTLGVLNKDGTRRGPLALDLPSMENIKNYFKKDKRLPTDIELESLAQTWSEHCKHTIFANPIDNIKDGLYKTYIKKATEVIRKKKGKKDFCVSVFSDNAGGIAFNKDYVITHKVETHNSPSALDPYGGAMTGIVGVNRDTIGFGLGAKPVANTYGFCFGDPLDTRLLYRDKNMKEKMLPPKRILEGVVKGINVGGNCSGIPTVSGFVRYDDRYRGKPLVFAGTVGIIPRKIAGKPSHQKNAQNGDYVVVLGGRVGADGIHGATFSSVEMDSNSPAGAVQIGDPITQKKFSDAIIKEARDMNLYNSITDNGAGGISCSIAEMAKECGGVKVDLEKVPLKYAGLQPWEIWISESQERMTLAIPKKKWDVFEKLMKRRGVEATVVGEFNNSDRIIVNWNGSEIMNLDMEFLHNGLPKQQLKTKKVIKKYETPVKNKKISYTTVLEDLIKNKNITGHAFISEQYDHEVQGSSVLKPIVGKGRLNTDAQIIRPVLGSGEAAVLSYGIYPSYGDISTYHMASCAIDTAIRNSVCAGGKLAHTAILDNFCWCSSDDEERLYELVESLKACYKYSVGYGTPFISGKDSMFNDFKGYDEKGNPIKISIPPTLLISAISVMPDLYKATSPEFKTANDVVYLLGETNNELGASEYYKLISNGQNKLGNNVPQVDLEKNIKIYKTVEKLIENELLNSALSITSGGLAVALAKASIGSMLGAEINISSLKGKAKDVEAKLFSESQGRIVVSVSPRNVSKFEKAVKGIAYTKLGKVNSSKKLLVVDTDEKVVEVQIEKLHKLYHNYSNSMK